MAIPTASGTEILTSVWLEDVDDTEQLAITGVENHIYTVLGFTICESSSATREISVYLYGRDSGESAANNQYIALLRDYSMKSKSTFSWNDRFSFHGFGSNGGAQSLRFQGSASSAFDIQVTYVDQNWT